jgi:membrane associated rhomboid family serine protease
MLPLGDENEPGRTFEPLTLLLIVANVVLFFIQTGSEAFTYGYSLVPFEITHNTDLVQPVVIPLETGERVEIPHFPGPDPIYLTFLSSMFMHGGLLHIGGNMLYLWIFGDNIERALRGLLFLGFYLGSGVVASLSQIVLDAESVIPNLGASGAISGVLGAYLVLFPTNQVRVLMFRFITSVPAVVAIGMWAVFQFINGFGQIFASQETGGGVAYGAHIGGFICGVVLGFVFKAMGAGSRARLARF